MEQLSLFFLGGGAYAALELAWRGTTHWTMFAAGGACLCLLQKLAAAPLPLAGAAALAGAWIATNLDVAVLRKPFGVYLLLSGVSLLWPQRRKKQT